MKNLGLSMMTVSCLVAVLAMVFIGLLALTEFARVPSQTVATSGQVQISQVSGGATTADTLKAMAPLESKRPDEPIKPIAIPTIDNPKAVALGQKL